MVERPGHMSDLESTMDEKERAELDRMAESLAAAWNAADGPAFGRWFTEDADFVNILAMHFVGRATISQQHQLIFDGIYRGSRNTFKVAKTRQVSDNVVVALFEAHLHVPVGPKAGDLDTLATAMLIRDSSGWHIASFQNTVKQDPPGAPPRKG